MTLMRSRIDAASNFGIVVMAGPFAGAPVETAGADAPGCGVSDFEHANDRKSAAKTAQMRFMQCFLWSRSAVLGGWRRLRRAAAGAELAVHVQERRRVVADHLQLRDDFAAGLFLLDLLGEEPLQLGDGGERLLGERDLIERVNLLADCLLLLERPREHVEQRGVG